jgi:hypothetical protein
MAEPSVDTVPAAPEPEAGEIRNDQDAIKAVEALLATPSSEEPEKAPDEPEPVEIPGDLTSLAEKLQATPDKLYGVKVPMADGESRTLGELKDGFRSAQALEAERGKLHEERSRFQTDHRQTLQELEDVVRHFGQALTPEAVQAVRAARNQRLQGELADLLEAVPEWKDPVRWTAERQLIEQVAQECGYRPGELDEIADARILRVLRRAALAKESKGEPVKPAPKVAQAPRPAKQPSQAQEWGRVKAAVTSRRIQPVDAVAQLLKDSGHGR